MGKPYSVAMLRDAGVDNIAGVPLDRILNEYLVPLEAGEKKPHHQAEASWPRLDETALYGLPGDVVRTLEPHTEADPAGLLFDFLAAFGSAVGSGPHAMADGARHPGRLYVVLVGETSKARKGTARRQIARLLADVDSRWASERVMSGLASGEGLIAAVRDGNGGDDQGVGDKRLLAVEEEFARVLAVAGRDGSTLSPVIRQAWDSGNLRVMTRKDPLAASEAHVSVIAHTTVEELKRRLLDIEVANGFANRFLFVAVRRSKLLATGSEVDAGEFSRLVLFTRKALDASRRTGLVKRSPDADDLWRDLYQQMADEDASGLSGAITARAEAQVLRLSLLYALTDSSQQVETEHLAAAWASWRFAEASARCIFGDALGDEVADRLLAAIRAAGKEGLDGTEQHNLFGRHVSRDRIAKARALLEEKRLIETTSESTGGRPRVISCAISALGAERVTDA